MAGAGLTGPEQDPAARRVIGGYLTELADQLGRPSAARAAIVAELEDGLWTATIALHASGLPPEEAARAAVAEFGDPRTVAAGFGPEMASATGRRVGLSLLATGPLVGSCWLLLAAATWRWAGQEPPAALGLVAALVGLVLVVAVPAAVLSVAASGRLSRWLPTGPQVGTTAAAVAAVACVAGDLVLLGGLLASTELAGGVAWPAALLAAGASSTRLSLAGRAARRCLAARATLTEP
jgi:HAAS domain-containing protein